MTSKAVSCLEHLPVYITLEISKYLSASDINNCCGVSHAWHSIFGQDPFWKKHCDIDVIAYLKDTPCKVRDIKAEMSQDPVLKQMGEWRLNYVLQNQLRKNWLDGRYTEMAVSCEGHLFSSNDTAQLYDEDFLFIVNSGHVKIFKIEGSNSTFIRQVNFNIPSNSTVQNYIFHRILNDKFVFSKNNFVKVFDISVTDDWPVWFTFLFDKTEKESRVAIEQKLRYNTFYEHMCKYVTHIATGDFYVGNLLVNKPRPTNIALMHIWNFRTKKKLKVERVPIGEGTMIDRIFLKNTVIPSDYIILECCEVLHHGRSPKLKSYYFVYNLATLKFSPLRVVNMCPKNRPAVLNNRLYIMNAEGLFIYDCNKCHEVICWYPYLNSRRTTIIGDGVVASRNSSKKIKLLHLHSGKIYTFNNDFESQYCKRVWDKFVMFGSSKDTPSVSKTSLWVLGEKPRQVFCLEGSYESHNKVFTKFLLTCNNKLTLLNFW